MALPGCCDAAFDAPPRHDRGVGRQAAFQNLIPTYDLPALAVEEAFDAANEIALQTVFVFQSFFLDERLAGRAGFPAVFGALVAADVDILAGKKPHDFGEDILQKSESFLFGAIHVFKNAPFGGCFKGAGRAGQFGIRREGCQRVAGEFYFRHNGDVSFGGVAHHLADFVLCVKTAVALAVEAVRLVAVMTDEGFFAPGGHFL